MRERRILLLASIAAMLGLCLGTILIGKTATRSASRPVTAVPPPESAATPPPDREPVTVVKPLVAAPAPIDTYSSSEAILILRRQDKNEIAGYVDKLAAGDAEYLCFILGLIPKDEVFDKVNVKGRLKRYVDGLRIPADFADLEVAFQQLERDRRRP